jgi:hypothetical protein
MFSQEEAEKLVTAFKRFKPKWYVLHKDVIRDDVYVECKNINEGIEDWAQFWNLMTPLICEEPVGQFYIKLKDLWEDEERFDVPRAKFLLDKLCHSAFCDLCGHELIFSHLLDENETLTVSKDTFVAAYPNDRDFGEAFYCYDCETFQIRCGKCFTIDENLCEDCCEKEEEEFAEEYKCIYCLDVNTATHWCDGCGQQACDDHCVKCNGCSLIVCFVCHSDGKGCKDTH